MKAYTYFRLSNKLKKIEIKTNEVEMKYVRTAGVSVLANDVPVAGGGGDAELL